MKIKKSPQNPILYPLLKNHWESLAVLNPAVIYNEEDKLFHMFYRAAGNDETHYIYLGYAISKDGIHFERQSNNPIIEPDKNGADGGGVEDPRIVKIEDYFYLTYASRVFAPGQYWKKDKKHYGFQPKAGPMVLNYNNTETHLAISKDLKNWKKLGRITDPKDDDRDVVIFPRAINGKFYRTSRPSARFGKGYPCTNPSIWLTSSDDLLSWNEQLELFYEGKEDWESLKVGASCPPFETSEGWIMIYHGVSKKDKIYRVGAFLLDKNNPMKILARTKKSFMEPEFDYETKGFYNGCVFPTANVVKDGTVYIYYGCADRFIGLATVKLSDLIEELKKEENKCV